jgi:hypothetical protein
MPFNPPPGPRVLRNEDRRIIAQGTRSAVLAATRVIPGTYCAMPPSTGVPAGVPTIPDDATPDAIARLIGGRAAC